MTPPPPLSSDAKFWGIFIPISERGRDAENLVFGQGGDGSGGQDEMVVEVLVRGRSDASGRRKAVERFLEGWDIQKNQPVSLSQMSSLASIYRRKTVVEEVCLITLRLFNNYSRFRFAGSPRSHPKRIV